MFWFDRKKESISKKKTHVVVLKKNSIPQEANKKVASLNGRVQIVNAGKSLKIEGRKARIAIN